MHTKNKQQIGAFGEQAVTDFLIKRNVEVIERNWRIREGEIDIVALNASGIFSFIEVKTRSSVATFSTCLVSHPWLSWL
jgi:putative endonuclease